MNTRERLTDVAATIISDGMDDNYHADTIAADVMAALLPEITNAKALLTLAEGSIVVGRLGRGYTRTDRPSQPWRGFEGGYGSSTGDLVEISQRMFHFEGPFTLVWQP